MCISSDIIAAMHPVTPQHHRQRAHARVRAASVCALCYKHARVLSSRVCATTLTAHYPCRECTKPTRRCARNASHTHTQHTASVAAAIAHPHTTPRTHQQTHSTSGNEAGKHRRVHCCIVLARHPAVLRGYRQSTLRLFPTAPEHKHAVSTVQRSVRGGLRVAGGRCVRTERTRKLKCGSVDTKFPLRFINV